MNGESRIGMGDQASHVVVLPCEPAQFRDFISGLLGRPQKIGRSISGPFDVKKDDLENIYYLIEQRLHSQNDATLMSFRAKITFSDKSYVELNSLMELLTYSELKPLISVSVQLSWIYLVKFSNKTAPEKQEIEVIFSTFPGYMPEYGDNDLQSRRVVYDSSGSNYLSGNIFIQINHTDRTWGTDIDSLLMGHLRLLYQANPRVREFASKNSGRIGLAVALIAFFSAMVAILRISDIYIQTYLSKPVKSLSENALANEAVVAKLDFVVEILTSSLWSRNALYIAGLVIVAAALSVALGFFVGAFAEVRRPSFVLFTSHDAKYRETTLEQLKISWITFCGSVIGAIILGVVGNYAFAKLTQHFPMLN